MINKLLFLSITIFLFACGDSTTNSSKLPDRTPGIATVKGTIKNPNGKMIELSSDGHASRVSIENGEFTIPANLTEAGYYTLKNGRQSMVLFIAPGFDVTVNAAGRGFYQDLSLTGKGAKENIFLRSRMNAAYELLPSRQNNYQLPENEFIGTIEDYRKAMTEKLDQYIVDNPELDEEFIALEKLHINYDCAIEYFQYPQYNAVSYTHLTLPTKA